MNYSQPKSEARTGIGTLGNWLIMLFTLLLLAACGSSLQPTSPGPVPSESAKARFTDSDFAKAKLELATSPLDAASPTFSQAMQKTQTHIEKVGKGLEVGAQSWPEVLPGSAGFLYFSMVYPGLAKPHWIWQQEQTSSFYELLYNGTMAVDSVAGTLSGEHLYASMFDGNDYEIYYINAATSVITQLTNDSVDNTYVTTDRTGKLVAWQVPGAGGKSEIRLRIYDNAGAFSEGIFSGDVSYHHPRINSNARRMVYVQDGPANDILTLKRLYDMNIPAGVLYQASHITEPSIDNEGRRIAFLMENGPYDFMRVVNVITGQMEMEHFGDLQHPSITADGRWLAFAEKLDTWRIRSMSLQTKAIANATAWTSPVEARNPHWEKPWPFAASYGMMKVFDPKKDSRAGTSVDIDGDFMVVGSYGNFAHILKRNGQSWEVVKALNPNDPYGGNAFGTSVAISGDTVLVSDPSKDGYAGVVYIFQRNQGGINNWGLVTQIERPLLTEDEFGYSLDISGDIAVMAPMYTDSGSNRVYVFGRNKDGANQWGFHKSHSYTPEQVGFHPLDVAVSGNTVAVGIKNETVSGKQSAGAVYLYGQNVGGTNAFGQLKKLTASDPTASAGFGFSVALTADTLAVGAVNANAAYVFERNQGGNGAWGQVKKLTASDTQAGDDFGWAVDIRDNTIVVGAPKEDGKGSNRGAAYVFERLQGGLNMWGEVSRLTAYESSTKDGDQFGTSVATNGGFVAVGIPNYDGDFKDQGGIYYFKR